MSEQNDYAGIAALSICEALLLALNDHKLLPESEIMGVLRDAAAAHENAVTPESEREMHRAVAHLINQMIAGGKLDSGVVMQPGGRLVRPLVRHRHHGLKRK